MNPISPKTQVMTRSASSNSSKNHKTLSTPVTSEEILKAIADLKSIQSDTLTQCKANAKNLDTLISQISELKSENITLKNDISALNTRIANLEKNNPGSSHDSVSQLMFELSEREKCSSNLIAFGVPESNAPELGNRISEDLKNLSELISSVGISAPPDIKVIRLGRRNDHSSRPLKIFLKNKLAAVEFLKLFNTASKRSPNNQVLKLVRDKTLREREQLRSCHSELDRRTKSGEADLTISYLNGVPTVLKRKSKNGSHFLQTKHRT
ncbi:uncharacterized protein LOC126899162 [Daktulosphaira vitifoliae]|uniref:uncharacterized protein LOC126899162 n=1 Tax=Daktulosphaira vitifoliae TaxID=58002 RepID=UPI0021A9C882|nr:uncharacterized protein LOC126899162 [Daktulosphaira vitifoliae]